MPNSFDGFCSLWPGANPQWRKGGTERAEARGPTNLHFSKSFFDKKYFPFQKRSSLAETTKVFKILALRGWGFGGKCDMLVNNSILIFMSKNLLKVRIAVVIS